jgi:hypothetical protein
MSSSESLPQYRSVNSLAISALLFGLASPLALVNPLLLAVAGVAVVLAVMAIRQIAANADLYSGRSLALCGLFLGVLFLAYTPLRLWMRFERLNAKAEQLAGAFLTLLQEGKYFEAQQLSRLRFGMPRSSETADDKVADGDFQQFKDTPWMKSIAALDQFTFRLDGLEPLPRYPEGDALVMRYLIVPNSESKKRPFPIWIHITRTLDPKTGAPSWRIQKVQLTYEVF